MSEHNDDRLLSVLDNLTKIMASKERKELREERWFRVKVLLIIAALAIPVGIYASGIAHVMSSAAKKHVAVVRIDGMIGGSNEDATRRALRSIRVAMNSEYSEGLILQINSGGGSPTQAEIIHKTLRNLREKHPDKKVIAVAEDAAASAAYLIATGAEEIYAQKSSLMGSIGVIYQGFGVQPLMDKLGVEARVRTSGEYKDVGSMFRPWGERDEEVIAELTSDLHNQFIQWVSEGREGKLKYEADMFSGRFWSGEKALEMGLIDGIATYPEVVESQFKDLPERVYGAPNAFEILKAINSRVSYAMDQIFRF